LLRKFVLFESKFSLIFSKYIKIPLYFRREIIQYTLYSICDCIQILFSHNYTSITFLMMYGTMWSLNIRFDTRFFAIASCLMGFMRCYVIDFFSNAIRDLSNYLVARKRIEVCINNLLLIFKILSIKAFLLLDECERDNRLLSSSYLELPSSNKMEKDVQVICNLKEAQWDKVVIYRKFYVV
jgi:hypothetical protein